MQAQDLHLTQLLQGAKQFIIPIFQRTYSWEPGHCEQLWRDIMRVGASNNKDTHFIGSAVYIPETDTDAAISRWLVIDGQQRITTVMLILLCLKQRLEQEGLENPVSAAEIEDYYLKNRYGKSELKYKILLTQTDRETLISLFDDKDSPEHSSRRILENYEFFKEKIQKADLSVLYKGIQNLKIVDVCLQQGVDNPQMIFESMNSTGKALTQADLIRNFVLMSQAHEKQTRLYSDYWRPIEASFGAESYNKQFDEFMRFFLVIHTGNYRIRKDAVYQEFKSYSHKHAVEDLLSNLKTYARYYCSIALGQEKDLKLAQAFHDIRELRADVCYPLLMEFYADYENGLLSHEDFLQSVLLVESYVFRRVVCDIPTNSMRQTFATFSQSIIKTQYIESVKAKFLLLPSYRRFPQDDEFKRQLQSRNLYKFNRRSYWLRRFENHNMRERVQIQNYTIEHIMPQTENLRTEWKKALGEDWQRVHQQYLHTLGNLTLTGYNAEYSDRPFIDKRDMEHGFKQSPLKLNRNLGQYETWNEQTIKERAEKLSEEAVNIWVCPSVPDETLEEFRAMSKKKKENHTYSIEDHPQLKEGLTREFFDLLRIEILGLDECVREEFLKLYIAYKAETNFVDVIPKASSLRLIINMNFTDIDDPRNICRDVTDLGRWGNGNIEVDLNKAEDIPYMIGLIRQSLERQLGEDEVEE